LDDSSKTFRELYTPTIKTKQTAMTNPVGPFGYYISSDDSFLYSFQGPLGGKEFTYERAYLPDICEGTHFTRSDKFVMITALGPVLALRDAIGNVAICDTSDKKIITHFALPANAQLDLFELVAVPLGQGKGGYKLLWSTHWGNM
jgi:hypothetical protein